MNKKIETKKFNVKNGRGINYVLNKAYKILGNPIMMFDTTYKLLAHTENKIKDDFVWNEIANTGTFSHDTVNFFSKEHFITEVAEFDIALLSSKKLKYERINAKIFGKDNNHIANISILACYKPFDPEDIQKIKKICESLSTELQKSEFYENIERVFEETFVANLIEDKITDKSYVQNNLEELYANLKSQLYIAVIDITKYEDTLTHLAYFRDLFRKIQKDFKYFIYLNNIIAIISTDNERLNIKKDLNELDEFCATNNIYIGISDCFQNLLELQKHYKEAINALNYGMDANFNNERHTFEYVNFKMEHFLSNITSKTNIKDLCHPVIFQIQRYDEENKTSYYNLLDTYLLVGRNSHLASKILNIENSTFCDKLQEIADIFDIDWNNGDMMLSVFISIKIIKYFL